jgi:hypothetical protein
MVTTTPPGLGPDDVVARFDVLQRRLVALWDSMSHMSVEDQTIVVVPSISLAKPKGGAPDEGGAFMQAYEERFLFLLLLLRQPSARMVYVTSQPILPNVIDYYLNLLPGVIPSQARPRLSLVTPMDSAPRPLTEKLLARPRLLERIRSLIGNPERAHLVPYNTTELERDLAVRLGIPMYGADPRYFGFGTKSGGRQLFAEEDVPHPIGIEDLWNLGDVADALVRMRAAKPSLREVLVKLNEGVSGEGNALVDLADLPAPGSADEREHIEKRLAEMRFEAPMLELPDYVDMLVERGGVVEERIVGEELLSPSVQLRITPLGEVELLSTHDQLLGGASGQSYLGCKFPADPAYAPLITREAAKVAQRLAKEGVIGRFALDFVVVRREDGSWEPYAIEINLRKGGTTHPFLTLQFLTDGVYDADRAVFTAPSGKSKFFVASDHQSSPYYKGLTPDDLFDIVVRHGLHFDQSRQTGVVFHMMSGLSEAGSVGLTAVGDTAAEADSLFQSACEALDEEARSAWEDGVLTQL